MTTPATKPWYSIKQAPIAAADAGAVAAAPEILIYQDIGANWWSEDPITAAQFRADLQAIQASEITVRILSMGGSVHDGLGIYNALKQHPAQITTINDGVAASIASLIFMAGDVRIASANSMTMIHAPWTWVDGNAQALRDAADMLDAWASAMASSYAEASGKTKDEILALLADGKDHYYTADEAMAMGFATQVGEASPAPAQAMSMQRLAQRAQAGRAPMQAQASQPVPPAAAAAQPLETVNMTTNTQPPAANPTPAADPAILAAARQEGVQAEVRRRGDITAAFAPFALHEGMADVQAACLADVAITVEDANRRILAQMGRGASSAAGGRIVTVEDERDKICAAATQSIMARAAVHGADGKPVRADATNPMRGHSLLDLARASLSRAGVNAAGMDKMQVVAAAFTQSTSDFPVLLENAMYKTLQASYSIAPDTWTRFCARGSVSDFRVNPRYRIGSLGNLDAKNELGEFKTKTIPDGEKANVSIATKGNTINVSREAVINDDLGAFVGLAGMLGRSAKRTVEADVYALLAANPVLADGIALFHASHNNLAGAGAAPTVVSVDAVRVAMSQQMDVSGNDYLDLRGTVVLCPMSLGSTFRILNTAEYDPDTANKLQRPNVVRGLYSDVVDTPRLSGTAWFVFASPADAPVLEVDFLDGNDVPYLEMRQGWNVDGSSWKVRLDYGVNAVDFRGAYKQPGA